MFCLFIYQKNRKKLFSCQKVKENKLIKAKGVILQIQSKQWNSSFILKGDSGKFFQSDKKCRFSRLPNCQKAKLPRPKEKANKIKKNCWRN